MHHAREYDEKILFIDDELKILLCIEICKEMKGFNFSAQDVRTALQIINDEEILTLSLQIYLYQLGGLRQLIGPRARKYEETAPLRRFDIWML